MELTRRELLASAAAAGVVGIAPRWANAARKPFPELRASGTAGAIGLAHGRTFAAQVQQNVRFYLRWFEQAIGLKRGRALRLARRFVPVLRRHAPLLLEEIDGIAKGARCKRDEVLAVNARTDLLVLGRRRRARGKRAELDSTPGGAFAVPGCTALALTGSGGRRKLIALGQNWDWRRELARNTVVLRLQRKGAPRLVTFTEAGMVGKIGFNERRLGVCLNFLSHSSDDPRGPVGVPVHLLLRAVMECETLEQAYKLVAWSPRCASANFLMAQHRGKRLAALDLEWTASAVGRLAPSRGMLVHTNHFKNAALAPGCRSGRGRSTTNRYRMATLRARKLARKVSDPVARMRRVLADRSGAPYSVSKTSAKDSPSMTLASVIMDLSRNQLILAAGPPHRSLYVARPGV